LALQQNGKSPSIHETTEKSMNEVPCRDCGYLLDADARGCPRCAMNVEAERMIGRAVAVFVIAVVMVAGGIVVIYFVLQ